MDLYNYDHDYNHYYNDDYNYNDAHYYYKYVDPLSLISTDDHAAWIDAYRSNPGTVPYILGLIDDNDKAVLLSLSPMFEIEWIDIYDLPWDYTYLAATFAREGLSLSYVEEQINNDWCFHALSYHPDLTEEFVQRYKEKDWCYITLFRRDIYTPDLILYVTVDGVRHNVTVPSYFGFDLISYRLGITPYFAYYTDDPAVEIPLSTRFSELTSCNITVMKTIL